ncbi:RRP12-like protein [Cimex lectularius]|uniref:RRP12-like protein n=1 Tax=Cimex lectularius TaxID=79782 RepID=A0A8I6RX29_CIMLE|nr:RRP12-like protein [Cimex lectularius]
MAKFRKRVTTKGKKWKKGFSSSSNPQVHKFREAAKTRFFQPIAGSGLTEKAVEKHNAVFSGSSSAPMDEDSETVGGITYKTFDTFASDWSACSNESFSKLVTKFKPDSAMQKNMLAVLAAVTEVIKQNNGEETTTEYFGALLTSLSADNDDETISAIVNLLSLCIKAVPEPVLQLKFSEASTILLQLLGKYVESEKVPLLRAIIGCLCVLLRVQEAAVWNNPSTINILNSVLAFVTFSKPKIRKAAQHGITVICVKSKITPSGLNVIAKHCTELVESVATGGMTTTLHMLTLLKEIMHTFLKKDLKVCCEAILKIMTLNNVLVTSCSLAALHNLFSNNPQNMTVQMNARLINALYDYQPPPTDTQPTQAWLVVLQEAHINLSKSDIQLCTANLPKFYKTCTNLYSCGRIETVAAVTHTLQSVTAHCVGTAIRDHGIMNENITSVVEIVQSCLSYQYHTFYNHILHLISALFNACGEQGGKLLTEMLKMLADLRDSDQVTFMNELENAIGSAVRALGPQVVIEAIPLQIKPGDGNREFKRSWLLPVLKDNIKASTLKCFVDNFLSLATASKNESDRLKAANDQVGSLSYDLLQSQIWSLLPSFSKQPSDITESFPGIAKALGGVLTSRKDLRLFILSTLRHLINYAVENKREDDIATLARFAKNYLPILFNIYTTKVSGTDEEGARLASLETIKIYLKIADQNLRKEKFDLAMKKVESSETEASLKEYAIDLLRALIVYQNVEDISKLYTLIVKELSVNRGTSEQKKFYRLLEEIFISEDGGCREFLNTNIDKIKELLLNSFSKANVNSKGSRLKCILELLKHSDNESNVNLMEVILPETILCLKDINSKCRLTAYAILEHIYTNMQLDSYLHIVMAGLNRSPILISCSLLALAALFHRCKDSMSEEIEEQILYNVGLLAVCSTREIVASAMSFIKVYITSFPRDKIERYIPKLMQMFSNMSEDCKRHNRIKTRDLLSRLVRWFGAATLQKHIPDRDEVLKVRVRNLGKLHDRKMRRRKEERESRGSGEDDAYSTFSVAAKHRSIEEILAESDSDIDGEEENDDKMSKTEKRKRRKAKTWITEDADDIVDFTDISTAKKITGTHPSTMSNMPDSLPKKKKPEPFKMAPDGRLIITEDRDNQDDDEGETRMKKKKKPAIPGLENSEDDYEESDDDWMTVGGETLIGKKRARSVSSYNSSAPPNKYQAGGKGIHRPLNKASSVISRGSSKASRKKGNKGPQMKTGQEYRAKKAKGDVKKKGLPDPYAYIPLRRDNLNKRKRMKSMAQMKKILTAAKKGASIGTKLKAKRKGM